MSPKRDKFINFRRIEPKGVKAADKTVFMATGPDTLRSMCPMVKALLPLCYKMYFTAQT